jgi:hypothetical protein
MFQIKPKGLLVAAVMLSVPVFAATASAQRYYPYAYHQDPYTAHIQAEQGHIAGERHHLWHERNARDEALSRGDFFGAWALQQHMHQERHHLWHEQEHVNHQ